MSLEDFLKTLSTSPESIQFSEVMSIIEQNFDYQPTEFKNGDGESTLINQAGTNEGSCKIFAFAKLQGLSEQQVLACFGDYYRKDVLENPDGQDHQNIRNFIRTGWAGIEFSGIPLTAK